MYLRILALLALFPSLLWSGEWRHFSSPKPIRDAVVLGDTLWLATDGGVERVLVDFSTKLFTTADGLEASSQGALVVAENQDLYSISRYGIIAKYQKHTDRFETIHRSFSEKNVFLRNGLAIAAGQSLALVFDGSLAFLSTSTEHAIVTLNKIANLDLASHPIQSLWRQQDTLFLGIDSAIYARNMDWENLAQDLRMADPLTWKLVRQTNFPIRNLWWDTTGLVADSLSGSIAHKEGYTYRATPQGSLIIKNQLVTDSSWCINGACSAFWLIYQSSSQVWFGDSSRIAVWNGKSISTLPYWTEGNGAFASNLQVFPNGNVMAWAWPYFYWWNGQNFTIQTYNPGYIPDDSYGSAISFPTKSLAQDQQGNVYLSTWGGGILQFKISGNGLESALDQWLHPSQGYCVDAFIPPNYAISTASTSAPWGGMLASYWGYDRMRNGGIVFLDSQRKSHCLTNLSSSYYPGALAVNDQGSGRATLYMAYGGAVTDLASGGIDTIALNYGDGLSDLSILGQGQLRTGILGSPTQLLWDNNHQRLWVLFSSGLGYWERESDADSVIPVSYQQGYNGASLTGMDLDRNGDLWLSSRDKGAFQVKLYHQSPDSLVFRNIRSRNGLLSDVVYDVKVNAVRGEVWYAHDLGLSRQMVSSVRNASYFQITDTLSVRCYPNPFRPLQQGQMFFDRVNENAILILRNDAGQQVRRFAGEALQGGRVSWDGRNENGDLVAPGVYTWIARWGKHTRQGRFMVVR